MKKMFLSIMVCVAMCAVYAAKGAKNIKKTKGEQPKVELAKLQKTDSQKTVQVVVQECVNLSSTEAVWLPGQIQDKIKSNLQEYLGMRTVVDSKSEAALKKLQAQSESTARDENTAIELGKITTAKFAVFTKVRKTANGYAISADFTDLTTGEQLASVISKEYTQPEYLYGSTGAVDEITLSLASKLGIAISDLNKNLLASGSASFTVDEQLALAKQNEEQYKKLMSQYDSELAKLSVSNDLSAIENKRKIEAEKALLVEKQNAERKRQEDLRQQKVREAEDAKLEAERSIALKTQRDKMAKEAAEKAAEVRNLKMAKQGVFGQINIIESKKKALVEIRNNVEARCQELFELLKKDRVTEEDRIRGKSYSTVELGTDGKPTEAAKERREKQIEKSYQDLTNKFFADCDAVKASAQEQDSALLAEIRADQKALSAARTVSSMGDELKVSFGAYDGSQNGWVAYLSLYSEGVLLYTDKFIVKYDAISEKKAPDMKSELDDAVIAEYSNNVDMYNSLFMRGDPIVYFEIDYAVSTESDNKPSTYNFSFNKIRVINTVTGKNVQTCTLVKLLDWTVKPEIDLRENESIVDQEKRNLEESFINKYACFVNIPGTTVRFMTTEVTQAFYQFVMGENPSKFKGANNPVECVSWYDAILFCNKVSEICGLKPFYSIGSNGKVEQDLSSKGFRLPTDYEWEYAARGGQGYKYSGSDNLNVVGWYKENSGGKTHPVAQKKANGYGLYDMSGNVWEWVWDANHGNNNEHFSHGGSSFDYDTRCKVLFKVSCDKFQKFTKVIYGTDEFTYYLNNPLGFRIVRTVGLTSVSTGK